MKRTLIYWIGSILIALALLTLFAVLWMLTVVVHSGSRLSFLKGIVPVIVGAVVFLLVGFRMIRSEG